MLGHNDIYEAVRCGDITIDPFDGEQLNPNSYDVRLGSEVLRYKNQGVKDVKNKDDWKTRSRTISEKQGIVLEPNQLYLSHTREVVGSSVYVPQLTGKSSTARTGLSVHVTAGFGDLGYVGQWTLEIVPYEAVRVYPGMRLGQVYFREVSDTSVQYNGKYEGNNGAESTSIFNQFEGK
jgi:dCTP deaminase